MPPEKAFENESEKDQDMKVIFHKRPKLKNPVMITGLPGMGLVAKQVADYFVRGVKGRFIGEITSPHFLPAVAPFDNGQIRLIDDKIYRFYTRRGDKKDLLFFTGDYQPNSPENQHKLADKVIRVAEEFGVKELYTGAATPVGGYVEIPKVYGVGTSRESIKRLKEMDVTIMKEGAISGFNGIVLSYAKKRGIDSICLLGETYLIESIDVKAALALIKKLSEIIGIEMDISEIEKAAKEFDKRFQALLKQNSGAEKKRGLGYIY